MKIFLSMIALVSLITSVLAMDKTPFEPIAPRLGVFWKLGGGITQFYGEITQEDKVEALTTAQKKCIDKKIASLLVYKKAYEENLRKYKLIAKTDINAAYGIMQTAFDSQEAAPLTRKLCEDETGLFLRHPFSIKQFNIAILTQMMISICNQELKETNNSESKLTEEAVSTYLKKIEANPDSFNNDTNGTEESEKDLTCIVEKLKALHKKGEELIAATLMSTEESEKDLTIGEELHISHKKCEEITAGILMFIDK